MNCSTLDVPVLYHLLDFVQTHVHLGSDVINHLILYCPLLLLTLIFPIIRVFYKKSVLHIRWPLFGASASASVLPVNIQDWFILGLTGLISLLSKGLSRVFSSPTVRKYQLFGTQHSLRSNSHIQTRLVEKTHLWLDGLFSAKWCLCFLICYLGLP